MGMDELDVTGGHTQLLVQNSLLSSFAVLNCCWTGRAMRSMMFQVESGEAITLIRRSLGKTIVPLSKWTVKSARSHRRES
jgi:hypothetical protein